jgi:galactokinase/mevalonate kinase-like predicted kinase
MIHHITQSFQAISLQPDLGNRSEPDQTLTHTGSDRGLRISTWADIPRGSGLGTSSILAAALVRALLRVRGEPDSNEEVSHKVLVLEQLMGTGGGWQDQVGFHFTVLGF